MPSLHGKVHGEGGGGQGNASMQKRGLVPQCEQLRVDPGPANRACRRHAKSTLFESEETCGATSVQARIVIIDDGSDFCIRFGRLRMSHYRFG
jgi:hypothetical protein